MRTKKTFKKSIRGKGSVVVLKRKRSVPATFYAGVKTGATELKSVDSIVSGDFDLPGTITLAVPPPVEGSGFNNRIGRRIRMKSLQLRGFIYIDNTNAAVRNPGLLRLMFVYDRQPNGAVPSVADLLLTTDPSGATGSTVYAGVNMNNRDRFFVLRDRTIPIPPLGINGVASTTVGTMVYGPPSELKIEEFINLRGLEAHFKATTGAVTDIATGSIIMLTHSTYTDCGYSCSMSTRLKFYD